MYDKLIYKKHCSPLDQIEMINTINAKITLINNSTLSKGIIKKQLSTYTNKIEHIGDVEAILKTIIYYM